MANFTKVASDVYLGWWVALAFLMLTRRVLNTRHKTDQKPNLDFENS